MTALSVHTQLFSHNLLQMRDAVENMVTPCSDNVLAPSDKIIIDMQGKDGHWDPIQIKNACLANLQIIERFCHEVLIKHVVQTPSNKMKVKIQSSNDKNNAAWVPSEKLVKSPKPWEENIYVLKGYVNFGITSPSEFDAPLATKLDITAHEFGHGIVDSSANYAYGGEGGALHESFADVFAIMVKHFHFQTRSDNPDANWLIGEGKLRSGKKFGALRSLANPGKANPDDKQPKYYDRQQIKQETEDYGGAHKYCGIPNHAFYLASTSVGNHCFREIGHIWINSVLTGERRDNFTIFAKRTIHSVPILGYSISIQRIVAKAWFDVGINLCHMIPADSISQSSTSDDRSIAEKLLNYYLKKK